MTVKLAKPLKMMFPSVVDGRYDPKDIAREREEWQKEIDKGKVSLAVMDRLQERAENAEAALAKAEKERDNFQWCADQLNKDAADFKARADKAEAEVARLDNKTRFENAENIKHWKLWKQAEARVRELEAKTGFQRETRQRLKR